MDKTTKEGHLKATLKNTTKSSIWSSWCLGPSPSSLLYPVVVKTVDSWPLVPSACRLASSLLPLPVESSAGALGRVPSSGCSKTFQTLWPQLESPFPFTQRQPVHTRDCPLLPWLTPDPFLLKSEHKYVFQHQFIHTSKKSHPCPNCGWHFFLRDLWALTMLTYKWVTSLPPSAVQPQVKMDKWGALPRPSIQQPEFCSDLLVDSHMSMPSVCGFPFPCSSLLHGHRLVTFQRLRV